MNPETQLRATEIVLNDQLVAHEAAHAASALVLGLDVAEAAAPFHRFSDLEGRDPGDRAGHVLISHPGDEDGMRRMALALLAGPLEDRRGYWPPAWPLTLVPEPGDESDLIELVKALDLDEDGYSQLVNDAYDLAASPEYQRLHAAISHWLETRGSADGATLHRLKAIAIEGTKVEHLLLKATTTATTHQGVFQAVISTEAVDREKDVVSATAMVAALRKWNRPVPLAWNHRTDAADIFGHIDPQSVAAVDGEVHAAGQVDLESTVGKEAWRSFKSRAIGFSFGYLIPDGGFTRRPGGGRLITALDVFEVTATPTPMNNATRVLSTKGISADNPMLDVINGVFAQVEETQRRAIAADALREKAMRIAREHAPIQTATFDC